MVSALRSPPAALRRPLRLGCPFLALDSAAFCFGGGPTGVWANRSSSSSEMRLDMLDDGDRVWFGRGVGMSAKDDCGYCRW